MKDYSWVHKYLGLPWKAGGRSDGEFDCWGLLREVYKTQLGVELPIINGFDARCVSGCVSGIEHGMSDWAQLDLPIDFCGVGLSMSKKFIHHVGVFLDVDGGQILHCHEKAGVIIESPSEMRMKSWRTINYYGHFSQDRKSVQAV